MVKSIYGLKQSALIWNKTLTNFLKSLNLQQSLTDNCLFFNNQTKEFLVISFSTNFLVVAFDSLHNSQVVCLQRRLSWELDGWITPRPLPIASKLLTGHRFNLIQCVCENLFNSQDIETRSVESSIYHFCKDLQSTWFLLLEWR